MQLCISELQTQLLHCWICIQKNASWIAVKSYFSMTVEPLNRRIATKALIFYGLIEFSGSFLPYRQTVHSYKKCGLCLYHSSRRCDLDILQWRAQRWLPGGNEVGTFAFKYILNFLKKNLKNLMLRIIVWSKSIFWNPNQRNRSAAG